LSHNPDYFHKDSIEAFEYLYTSNCTHTWTISTNRYIYLGFKMVKLGALAFGLLTAVAQVSAQQTVKIMPFGASIVSVSSS